MLRWAYYLLPAALIFLGCKPRNPQASATKDIGFKSDKSIYHLVTSPSAKETGKLDIYVSKRQCASDEEFQNAVAKGDPKYCKQAQSAVPAFQDDLNPLREAKCLSAGLDPSAANARSDMEDSTKIVVYDGIDQLKNESYCKKIFYETFVNIFKNGSQNHQVVSNGSDSGEAPVKLKACAGQPGFMQTVAGDNYLGFTMVAVKNNLLAVFYVQRVTAGGGQPTIKFCAREPGDNAGQSEQVVYTKVISIEDDNTAIVQAGSFNRTYKVQYVPSEEGVSVVLYPTHSCEYNCDNRSYCVPIFDAKECDQGNEAAIRAAINKPLSRSCDEPMTFYSDRSCGKD